MYKTVRLAQRIKATFQALTFKKHAKVALLSSLALSQYIFAETNTSPEQIPDLATPAKITIIIDDIGNSLKAGKRVLQLPQEVTLAFLPFRPFTQQLAFIAQQQNRDIIVHMPMENISNKALGDGALTTKLDRHTFEQTVVSAIHAVPGARGLNNHMGSLLTTRTEQMQWLMNQINLYGLYFVDSKTTAKTVAWQEAQNHATPFLRRNVFLDHVATTEFIAAAFEKLKSEAKQHGHAIAIGHPYPETLAFLEVNLPKLQQEGFELITAQEGIEHKYRHTLPTPYPVEAPMLAIQEEEIRLVQNTPIQQASELLQITQ